jgi:signal peptidase II
MELTSAKPSASPTAVESRRPDAVLGQTSAGRHGPAWTRFVVMVVCGLVLDLFSKYWIFHMLRQQGHLVVIPGVFELQTVFNDGALFGMFRGQTTFFLIASVVAVVVVTWMFLQTLARNVALHLALGAIMAGALGNMYDRLFIRLVPLQVSTERGVAKRHFEKQVHPASGDLTLVEYPPSAESIRRVVPADKASELPAEVGYVRDFLKISQKWFGGRDLWPWVFNVADSLLVCGVATLVLSYYLESRGRRQPSSERETAADG